MLAEVDEEARLRDIIASLFASGELEPTPAWKKTTTKAAIKRRQTEAADEAAEAEKHAKELGLNDKLKKVSGEEELMALMKANSERRMGALISNLEAKYAGGGKKEKGKRSKKAAEESEEENVDKDDSPPKKRKSTRAR